MALSEDLEALERERSGSMSEAEYARARAALLSRAVVGETPAWRPWVAAASGVLVFLAAGPVLMLTLGDDAEPETPAYDTASCSLQTGPGDDGCAASLSGKDRRGRAAQARSQQRVVDRFLETRSS